MQRFLLLYTKYGDTNQYYAEGLVHLDGAVYVRGFFMDRLPIDLYALNNRLRDDETIQTYHIHMIDEKRSS
jgi:hypothetical protein